MESEQNLALTLLRMNMFENKATRSRMKKALMRRTLHGVGPPVGETYRSPRAMLRGVRRLSQPRKFGLGFPMRHFAQLSFEG